MKAPPFLLGASLLFWGWQTGLPWLGVVAAVALEAPRLSQARWEFSQADLDRVWNLCVTLFLGATIYAFVSNDNLKAVGTLIQDHSASSRLASLNQSKRSLFLLLQWLPLMFLPMALAQAYGQEKRLNLSTFSWWLRRKRSDPAIRARYLAEAVNVEYPYFACCLFGASAGNQRTFWFSAGLIALTAWPLWLHRSRSFGAAGWFASLLLAAGLGLGVQLGILEAQKVLQRLDEALLARWSGARNFDAKESHTRIGSIGRLKQSGRIVLRVQARDNGPPPLLREASYDLFSAPDWRASQHQFERVTPELNLSSWRLRVDPGPLQTVTIAGSVRGGTGLLALPEGVARLDNLPALGLATNLFGGVRVEDGPGFVQFEAAYRAGVSIDGPLSAEDRVVPVAERPAVEEVIRQLGLSPGTPRREAVRVVERFFADHFTYSTWQAAVLRPGSSPTALGRFLLEHRSGHCEYFATATVLLLRAAGIPARYAVGYAVQERQGQYYVVRERHAHAWCLAWIDNAWCDVDTTPADWAATELSEASWWEPVGDLFSRAWFEFSRWRWGHAEWKRYLLWGIVPLLALALIKLLAERQWSRARHRAEGGETAGSWPGLDSEFYVIEKKLGEAGLSRQPGETGLAWLHRVDQARTVPSDCLPALLAFHYRLRFDPAGVTAEERSQFREAVTAWIREASRPGWQGRSGIRF